MNEELRVRDIRKKDQYKIDDAYLNGYAKLCGIFATAVYNSLSRHADFHTQECFPSIEKIAEQHNISKPSVIKGIKELEKWGIITINREKDKKTKRQLPNIYLLIDKIDWKPKPEISRVNDVDTESRVNNRTEPSQSQNKSRVNDVDCKDTHIKGDHKEGLQNAVLLEVKSSKFTPEEAQILKAFEALNPACKKMYGHTVQQEACRALIQTYGFERIINIIENTLPKTNKLFYLSILTPDQLFKNFKRLEDDIFKYQQKQKSQKEKLKAYW